MSPSIERILVIVRKELRQALREPRMRGMLLAPPMIQLMVFGFAVNLDVEQARIGWMDGDRTQQSRELRAAFEGSGRFRVIATPQNDTELHDLMDRSKVEGVVRLLPGFGRDLQRGRESEVQVLVEGTNSNTASIVTSYAGRTIARFSAEMLQEQQRIKSVARTVQSGAPIHVTIPQLSVRPRVWFNADLRSRNYFIPGVIVNIITLVTLSLTAMAIVREKEIGTMEQLMVTPIKPIELILGKTIPFALIGFADTILVFAASLLIFHVPFRGSFLLLMVCAGLFLLTTLGAGLFVSTICRTQQQAMMSTFLCFMPFFLLSGFNFPIRNMPIPIQYLTYLNPVRYFVEIVRAIFLKGAGPDTLWPQMTALGVLGVTILGLSVSRFHKKLD